MTSGLCLVSVPISRRNPFISDFWASRRCSALKRCRPAVNLNMDNWTANTLPKCRGKGGYAVIPRFDSKLAMDMVLHAYTERPLLVQLTAGVYYSIATWLRLLFICCSGYEIFHKLAYVRCTIIGQNSSTYTVSQDTFQKKHIQASYCVGLLYWEWELPKAWSLQLIYMNNIYIGRVLMLRKILSHEKRYRSTYLDSDHCIWYHLPYKTNKQH